MNSTIPAESLTSAGHLMSYRSTSFYFAIGLTVVALVLRLYNLDTRSLEIDEVLQAHITDLNKLDEVMAYTIASGDAMPLLNILNWLMRDLANAEWVVRFPSAIAGALSVPVIYMLGKRLWNERAGSFAAAFLTFFPYQVWYGQEARPYTMLLLFTSMQMLFAHKLVSEANRHYWLWFTLASIVNLYTHYLAWAATISALFYLVSVLLGDLISGVLRSQGHMADRFISGVRQKHESLVKLVFLVLSCLGIFLAYLPWLPNLSAFLSRTDLGFNRFPPDHTPTFTEFVTLLATFDVTGIFILLLPLAIVALTVRSFRGRWKEGLLVLIWLGVPLAAFVIKVQGAILTVWPRYFYFLLPSILLLLAFGLETLVQWIEVVVKRAHSWSRVPFARIGKPLAYAALGALIIAQVAPALASSYKMAKEDTRSATQYLVQISPPDSVVLSVGQYASALNWELRYYLGRLNSPIGYLDGARLDDQQVRALSKLKGDVWGYVYDQDSNPIAQHLKNPPTGMEVVTFAGGVILFRYSDAGKDGITQAKHLLQWVSAYQPELLASIDLIDAWSGNVKAPSNLIPDPSPVGTDGTGWKVPSSSRTEQGTIILTSDGSLSEATWSTNEIGSGQGYILSFEFTNEGFSGWQRVYAVAEASDGRELATIPHRRGYDCLASSGWGRGMLVISTPDGTGSITVRLAISGTGTAAFRNVSLWRVR
jgi:hypothetical protein